jgi:hypothetical protein
MRTMTKNITFACLILAVIVANVLCQIIKSKEEIVKELKKAYRLKSDQDADAFYEILKMQLELWNKSVAANPDKYKAVSPGFPCQPYGPSPQKPTSVHRLRPGGMSKTKSTTDVSAQLQQHFTKSSTILACFFLENIITLCYIKQRNFLTHSIPHMNVFL